MPIVEQREWRRNWGSLVLPLGASLTALAFSVSPDLGTAARVVLVVGSVACLAGALIARRVFVLRLSASALAYSSIGDKGWAIDLCEVKQVRKMPGPKSAGIELTTTSGQVVTINLPAFGSPREVARELWKHLANAQVDLAAEQLFAEVEAGGLNGKIVFRKRRMSPRDN